MSNQTFRRPISVDRAPQGHRCDWCNKLAVQQLTAIGGVHHNQAGFFCEACGEEFTHVHELDTYGKGGTTSHLTWIPPRHDRGKPSQSIDRVLALQHGPYGNFAQKVPILNRQCRCAILH